MPPGMESDAAPSPQRAHHETMQCNDGSAIIQAAPRDRQRTSARRVRLCDLYSFMRIGVVGSTPGLELLSVLRSRYAVRPTLCFIQVLRHAAYV